MHRYLGQLGPWFVHFLSIHTEPSPVPSGVYCRAHSVSVQHDPPDVCLRLTVFSPSCNCIRTVRIITHHHFDSQVIKLISHISRQPGVPRRSWRRRSLSHGVLADYLCRTWQNSLPGCPQKSGRTAVRPFSHYQ